MSGRLSGQVFDAAVVGSGELSGPRHGATLLAISRPRPTTGATSRLARGEAVVNFTPVEGRGAVATIRSRPTAAQGAYGVTTV